MKHLTDTTYFFQIMTKWASLWKFNWFLRLEFFEKRRTMIVSLDGSQLLLKNFSLTFKNYSEETFINTEVTRYSISFFSVASAMIFTNKFSTENSAFEEDNSNNNFFVLIHESDSWQLNLSKSANCFEFVRYSNFYFSATNGLISSNKNSIENKTLVEDWLTRKIVSLPFIRIRTVRKF